MVLDGTLYLVGRGLGNGNLQHCGGPDGYVAMNIAATFIYFLSTPPQNYLFPVQLCCGDGRPHGTATFEGGVLGDELEVSKLGILLPRSIGRRAPGVWGP